jgi:hypothetical protein
MCHDGIQISSIHTFLECERIRLWCGFASSDLVFFLRPKSTNKNWAYKKLQESAKPYGLSAFLLRRFIIKFNCQKQPHGALNQAGAREFLRGAAILI